MSVAKETITSKLPLQIQIAILDSFTREHKIGTSSLKRRAGKENEVR